MLVYILQLNSSLFNNFSCNFILLSSSARSPPNIKNRPRLPVPEEDPYSLSGSSGGSNNGKSKPPKLPPREAAKSNSKVEAFKCLKTNNPKLRPTVRFLPKSFCLTYHSLHKKTKVNCNLVCLLRIIPASLNSAALLVNPLLPETFSRHILRCSLRLAQIVYRLIGFFSMIPSFFNRNFNDTGTSVAVRQ